RRAPLTTGVGGTQHVIGGTGASPTSNSDRLFVRLKDTRQRNSSENLHQDSSSTPSISSDLPLRTRLRANAKDQRSGQIEILGRPFVHQPFPSLIVVAMLCWASLGTPALSESVLGAGSTFVYP